MNSFLYANNRFENYSLEHLIAVAVFLLTGIAFILIGKYLLKGNAKYTFIILISLFVFFVQVAKVPIYQYTGIFDKTKDLPLHLCNMAPLFLFFAYLFKSRQAWAVFFFWIMAGTFQSLLTPTLHQSFPHYEWWRYWIIHAWLVTGAFYGMIVLGYRLKFKDVFISLFWLNILAAVVYLADTGLDANYMYLRGKPEGKTMYNLMSKWPYYIIELEFVAVFLFSILYLPFYLWEKSKR